MHKDPSLRLHIIRALTSLSRRGAGGLLIAGLMMMAGACDRRPDGVLSEREMESLMTDMVLADAYAQTPEGRGMPDSVRRHLGESVMKAHGVDYATLDSTYAWYARNLDDYYKLMGRVHKSVSDRRDRLAGNVMRAEGQMANDIWSAPQHITFSPLAANEDFVFEIGGERLSDGDRLEWQMHLSQTDEAVLLLGVDYTDGTTTVIERTFRAERKPKLTLASDTGRVASRIYGVMSVKRKAMPVYADSIRLLTQPFDSTTYQNSWSQRHYYGPRSKVKPAPTPGEATDSVAVDSVSRDSAVAVSR